jgi:ketosteroid isomerase-like protein
VKPEQSMNEAETGLWTLVRESNRAWISGSSHELSDFFDEHAVVMAPGMQGRVSGRAAVVASYAAYNMHARTHSFEEMEHQIELFGDVAVVVYRFRIRYQVIATGEQHDETAQETLVLRKTDRFRVLFRTQSDPRES